MVPVSTQAVPSLLDFLLSGFLQVFLIRDDLVSKEQRLEGLRLDNFIHYAHADSFYPHFLWQNAGSTNIIYWLPIALTVS